MANIPDSSFKKWKNNETIYANDYVKEREMLRIAINDNDERLDGLELGANNLRLDDNFATEGTGAGTYPLGLSTFRVIASSDWPVSDGFVETNRSSDGEATQTVSSLGPNPKFLFRNTSNGAWSAFETTEAASSVDKKLESKVGLTGEHSLEGPLTVTNQPYLEVSKTDIAAIQPNTWTKIIPNTLTENTGGGAWGAGDYTIPLDGVYLAYLGTNMGSIATGASQFTALYVNDTLKDSLRMDQRQNSGIYDGMMAGTTFVRLKKGDVINFRVHHTDSSARNLNYAYIRVTKLS